MWYHVSQTILNVRIDPRNLSALQTLIYYLLLAFIIHCRENILVYFLSFGKIGKQDEKYR